MAVAVICLIILTFLSVAGHAVTPDAGPLGASMPGGPDGPPLPAPVTAEEGYALAADVKRSNRGGYDISFQILENGAPAPGGTAIRFLKN